MMPRLATTSPTMTKPMMNKLQMAMLLIISDVTKELIKEEEESVKY
jgi:hypothetical protein